MYGKLRNKRSGKIRAVSVTSNVVRLPESRDKSLEEAIRLYDSGQFAAALTRTISLIDEGCDEAYYLAGCIYEKGGHGVERNLDKARFYYEKSVDEFGYVEGYLALGRLYYFSIGVPQDYQKAFEFFSVVAEKKNNGIAQMMLGQMYAFGHGVQQDFGIAREYFQKAADQGYVFPLSALSALEWRAGNYPQSIRLRIKAIWLAIRVSRSDPHDWRLRRS